MVQRAREKRSQSRECPREGEVEDAQRREVEDPKASKKNIEQLVECTPAEQLEHVIADLEVQC